MIKQSVKLDEVIAFLNELLKVDSAAVKALIDARVSCNTKLANHPTVQVMQGSHNKEHCKVGLLGLLNGIFGSFDGGPRDKWGCIAVEENRETGEIVRFFKLENEEDESEDDETEAQLEWLKKEEF